MDGLAGPGYAVWPGYAGADTARVLSAVLAGRQSAGRFRPAEVGGGSSRALRSDVRGDTISWIDECALGPAAAFFAGLEDLRLLGNRELMLGLATLEMHFASFAPGRGYARHRDLSPHGVDRVVSLIYYLNHRWESGDGGELEIETDEGPVLIEPRADTLVVFLSARFYHTVLPAVRERHSVTGWFHRRAIA